MKKTLIVLATLTAMLSAVSCRKENGPEPGKYAPMTFCAESEEMNMPPTKAEMAYRYDLLWQENDEILVKNASESAVFELVSGVGTTKGTFYCENSPFKAGDEVEAYYPQSIVRGTNLYWPDTLANNQIVPMYCKKTLSSKENETFSFGSLGSILQIVFNTTQDDVNLRFIDISDTSKTMSGYFKVEDGKAVITDTDKIGITVDLGESGVALGKGVHFFNVPVPAGDYQALTLIFTTTDGAQCIFKNGKLNIVHNTVGRLSLTGKKFKPLALPGVFSVGENKRIRFSKGNLYTKYHSRRNDWRWDFYNEQHGFNSIKCEPGSDYRFPKEDDEEIDMFCWGYGDWSTNPVDITSITPEQFRDWGEAIPESKGSWRTLSAEEWCYLFAYNPTDTSYIKESPRYELFKRHCTVCGKEECIVLAPDDFKGEIQSSYDAASWSAAEAAGFVCLVAAGYRTDTYVRIIGVGNELYYWSSTDNPVEQSGFWDSFCVGAMHIWGGSLIVKMTSHRTMGRSVRLVTDVE
ncbi:MAG: hypothetical protein MJY41_01530 [Bacteroidales bacterium]|nr:hypothetical protein [Bacteroidales bacterium]